MLCLVLLLAPLLGILYRQPRVLLSLVTMVDIDENKIHKMFTVFNFTASALSSAGFLGWVHLGTNRTIGKEFFNWIIYPSIVIFLLSLLSTGAIIVMEHYYREDPSPQETTQIYSFGEESQDDHAEENRKSEHENEEENVETEK